MSTIHNTMENNRGDYMITLCISFLAIFFNIKHLTNLLISALVVTSFYLPVWMIDDYSLWYATVVTTELLIMASAYLFKDTLSYPIIFLYAMMTLAHINSILFRYSGSYRYELTMWIFERLALLSCILFSTPIINKIKEFVKCHLSKH